VSIKQRPVQTSVVARRIKQMRIERGLSQLQLGALCELEESAMSARISRYEAGIHAPPVQFVAKFAAVMGVPLPYLYCEDDKLSRVIAGFSGLATEDQDEVLTLIEDKRKSGKTGSGSTAAA
jgi:transcriptional regulator with XRE-family HTH domain